MSVTVCVFVPNPSAYLHEPVGGASTLDRVRTFIGGLPPSEVPETPDVVVLAAHQVAEAPSQWQWRIRESWDVPALLEAIADVVSGPDESILYTFLDQPFLNLELTGLLLARHENFRADYTFADGYPVGLAPELLRGRSLAYLRELATAVAGPVTRGSLFEVIQKDMNRFDIETELSRTDQRLMRLVLAVDTRANLDVCRSLAEGAPTAISAWPPHVVDRKRAHRSLPRYVSVQVIEQEVHELAYSPYPGMRPDVLAPGMVMDPARFEAVVSEIAQVSPEAVVAISHWGEVGLHPDAIRLVDAVLAHPSLGLVVETSGVGWNSESRTELMTRERVIVIVGLDTDDPAVYSDIRGEGFAEAVKFAETALEQMPERAYVQAVRCDLTEPALDKFYTRWSAVTRNVIIQKYDSFSGRLPERRVGDIAPLHRFPCWHLQRDMTVLLDGSVPLCREDLESGRALGNVFDDGVLTVWNRGTEEYAQQVDEIYGGVCEKCDEYYTFNF